jgi:hypothetical protein
MGFGARSASVCVRETDVEKWRSSMNIIKSTAGTSYPPLPPPPCHCRSQLGWPWPGAAERSPMVHHAPSPRSPFRFQRTVVGRLGTSEAGGGTGEKQGDGMIFQAVLLGLIQPNFDFLGRRGFPTNKTKILYCLAVIVSVVCALFISPPPPCLMITLLILPLLLLLLLLLLPHLLFFPRPLFLLLFRISQRPQPTPTTFMQHPPSPSTPADSAACLSSISRVLSPCVQQLASGNLSACRCLCARAKSYTQRTIYPQSVANYFM